MLLEIDASCLHRMYRLECHDVVYLACISVLILVYSQVKFRHIQYDLMSLSSSHQILYKIHVEYGLKGVVQEEKRLKFQGHSKLEVKGVK